MPRFDRYGRGDGRFRRASAEPGFRQRLLVGDVEGHCFGRERRLDDGNSERVALLAPDSTPPNSSGRRCRWTPGSSVQPPGRLATKKPSSFTSSSSATSSSTTSSAAGRAFVQDRQNFHERGSLFRVLHETSPQEQRQRQSGNIRFASCLRLVLLLRERFEQSGAETPHIGGRGSLEAIAFRGRGSGASSVSSEGLSFIFGTHSPAN